MVGGTVDIGAFEVQTVTSLPPSAGDESETLAKTNPILLGRELVAPNIDLGSDAIPNVTLENLVIRSEIA